MIEPSPTSVHDLQEPPNFGLIAAFIDGESVDAEALKVALADPGGRDYLIDLLRLRTAVAGMESLGGSTGRTRSLRTRPWVRWSGAAAIALISAVGGYMARGSERGADLLGPAPRVETIQGDAVVIAPMPTQVIRFEPGRNWHVAGGH